MSHPQILAIEDNPADVSLLRIGLDTLGENYELTVLRDGEEALRFIEKRVVLHAREPCVILLDLHLPKYDGMEILRVVKRTPGLSHIHVLMLSSIARPEEEMEIQRRGAIYRDKPVSLEGYIELATLILTLCKQVYA